MYMKNNIIIFVIGLLLGAVITTGAFFVYSKSTSCSTNSNGQMQMPGGNPPEMPSGQNGQPPEMSSNN